LGGGGANAVKSVTLIGGGTRSYGYDASGNMTADNAGFAAKYDHANLATKLQRGAVINYFTYGPNNAKARQTGTDGSKVYLGGYEDWITAGQTKVSLGNYAQVTNGTGGRVLNYFLTDRLGSVDAVTDGNGNLVETRGYDAFGAPRTGTWGDASQIASTAITPKGFTSHEHLNNVQLIHMNGRMYDYQLGRFLGVDPFIQMPTNSQSMNPYSYIMNNPLSGTDPTGYLIDGICMQGDAGCDSAPKQPGQRGHCMFTIYCGADGNIHKPSGGGGEGGNGSEGQDENVEGGDAKDADRTSDVLAGMEPGRERAAFEKKLKSICAGYVPATNTCGLSATGEAAGIGDLYQVNTALLESGALVTDGKTFNAEIPYYSSNNNSLVKSTAKEINGEMSQFGNVMNLRPAVAGERSLLNIEAMKTRDIAKIFGGGGCSCERMALTRGWMRTETNTLIINSDTPFRNLRPRFVNVHEMMHFLTGSGHDAKATNFIKSYGEDRFLNKRDLDEINRIYYEKRKDK